MDQTSPLRKKIKKPLKSVHISFLDDTSLSNLKTLIRFLQLKSQQQKDGLPRRNNPYVIPLTPPSPHSSNPSPLHPRAIPILRTDVQQPIPSTTTRPTLPPATKRRLRLLLVSQKLRRR